MGVRCRCDRPDVWGNIMELWIRKPLMAQSPVNYCVNLVDNAENHTDIGGMAYEVSESTLRIPHRLYGTTVIRMS